jgi:cytochrome P450
MNPDLFPDPHDFRPERWLPSQREEKSSGATSLQRYFIPFSRGARMCIGINLAYAELYLTTAMVFSQFDFELHDTSRKDVQLNHDFFVGMPYLESKGVRVEVVKKI